MTQQYLRLLAEARWQTFGNSLRSRGKKVEAGAQLLVVVLAVAAGLGIGAGMAAGTYSLLSRGFIGVIPGLLQFIFFFWFYGPLLVEGSSPSLDFRQVARYPIPFRAYYLLSTVYGLLDPCALLCVGWLACVWLGVALARPAWLIGAALWLTALAAISLLFNRALFSVLEPVLGTRRGRERILAGVLFLAGCSQIFVYIVLPRSGKSFVPGVIELLRLIFRALPPGVASTGLVSANTMDTAIGVSALIGYGLVAALVLRRQLWRVYRGEVVSESPPSAVTVRRLSGWKLPGLNETTSTIVEKELRYASRDYRTLMAFLAAPFMACIFTLSSGTSRSLLAKPWSDPGLIFGALAAYILLASTQQLYNCFSFDVRGFACWVLTPVRPQQVFVGKNVAMGSLMAGSYLAVTGILAARGGIQPRMIAMVTVGFIFAAITMFGTGNLLSVMFPTPIELGRPNTARPSPVAILLGVLIQTSLLGFLALFFYLARRPGLEWLPLAVLPLLSLLALKFYLFTLGVAGRYMQLHAEEISAALR